MVKKTNPLIRRSDIDPGIMYTPDELISMLKVSARTIRNYCERGIFQGARKIPGGRRWLIPGSAVIAILPHEADESGFALDASTGGRFVGLLERITPQFAEVLVFYYIEGLSVGEIAERLDTNDGGVGGLIKQGNLALRNAAVEDLAG